MENRDKQTSPWKPPLALEVWYRISDTGLFLLVFFVLAQSKHFCTGWGNIYGACYMWMPKDTHDMFCLHRFCCVTLVTAATTQPAFALRWWSSLTESGSARLASMYGSCVTSLFLAASLWLGRLAGTLTSPFYNLFSLLTDWDEC